VRVQIGGRARRLLLREVRRAADDGEALLVAERHRDHVLRQRFGETDARIESFDDDIRSAVLR
jgi:hypothetical protein